VAWLRSRIQAIPNRYDVSVLVEATPEAVRAVVGHWGSVEPVRDGVCRLRMNVDDLGWPSMVLGMLGAPFTIESPEELRERVQAVGRALLGGARPSA
jgi:hypothetical protein